MSPCRKLLKPRTLRFRKFELLKFELLMRRSCKWLTLLPHHGAFFEPQAMLHRLTLILTQVVRHLQTLLSSTGADGGPKKSLKLWRNVVHCLDISGYTEAPGSEFLD
jgi:hypothetical protein